MTRAIAAKSSGKRSAARKIPTTHVTPDAIGRAISWAKNNLILPEGYVPRPGHPIGSLVQQVYPLYQSSLLSANAVDFDDLLLHVATLLRDNPEVRASLDERYGFILVDEYQDTNLAQYAIARALSIDHPNLAVTGDPDQSIYGWRGANLNNILEFEKDYPSVHVVRLERNYRSTKRILQVAADLIPHNVRRKAKKLFTENASGAPVRLVQYASHKEEAEAIAARIAADLAQRPPPGARFRHLLPRERPEPGIRVRLAGDGHPVPIGPQRGILSTQGNQGRHRVFVSAQ